jgi:DNA-binding NtrC family response regulator
VKRVAILTDGDCIHESDIPGYIREGENVRTSPLLGSDLPESGVDFNVLVDQFETQLIQQALTKTAWNKKAAAKLLCLNRTTLVEKIKKKGLENTLAYPEPARPYLGE